MKDDDRRFRKEFFQSLQDGPLEPGDEAYVPLYDDPAFAPQDPVEQLAEALEFTPGSSVQLLSGYRGTGKTTELHRLAARLPSDQYKVVHVSMDSYLNMSTPVDVSDFLLALTCAFGEGLRDQHWVANDPLQESAWNSIYHFFKIAQISIPELSVAGIKAYLKSELSFRSKLHGRMAEHIETLVTGVKAFFQECHKAIKARWGQHTEVVFIADSIEHLHGTYENGKLVQASVTALFTIHAERLHLPYVHVIYTVPPYLGALAPNVGQNYGMGAVHMFPAVKVHDHGGHAHDPGIDALRRLVEKRGDWQRLLGTTARLEQVLRMSGGNIRGLLRLLRQVILTAQTLPVDDERLRLAINQLRIEFLPIADNDALWLAKIARTHSVELADTENLPTLARFFESQLVLCYPNGPVWYDVHPLIRELVLKQAEALEKRRRDTRADEGA